MKIEIEQVENGYIITNSIGSKSICTDITSIFDELMLIFEGKSKHFANSLYAKITVDYKEPIYFEDIDIL